MYLIAAQRFAAGALDARAAEAGREGRLKELSAVPPAYTVTITRPAGIPDTVELHLVAGRSDVFAFPLVMPRLAPAPSGDA